MRIDSSGKVGIGTSSPIEKLQVAGQIISTSSNSTLKDSGAERAIMDLTSNAARIGHFRGSNSSGSGKVEFFVDSVKRVTIDPDGNVGIGTTSPTAKLDVNGVTSILSVEEKVTTDTTTSGTLTFDTQAQAVVYLTANQTANRTINFSNANSNMATGESMTFAVLATQGGTAYYLNAYQVDGSSVTPKWQGGSAPTAGNASGIDAYSFTIIKTADATFTVLASVTQYA